MKSWIGKLMAFVTLVSFFAACRPAPTTTSTVISIATITPILPATGTPIQPKPTSLPATDIPTQSPTPSSQTVIKSFGGSHNDEAWDMLQAIDGGSFIVGTTNVQYEPEMQGDVYLIRIDAAGNLLWEKTYGGPGYDTGQAIFNTSDGGLVIAGYTNSFGEGDLDSYLIGIDQDGTELWSKTFGGPLDEMTGASPTADGGYLLVGNIVDPNDFVADPGEIGYGGFAGRSNIYISRIDITGKVLWEKTYGGTNNLLFVNGVLTPDGGGLILANCLLYPETGDYIYLLKVDQDGNEVWSRTWEEGTLNAYDLITTTDGNYLMTGSYTPPEITDHSEADALFIKIDPQGKELWRQIIGEPGLLENGRSLLETSDGGFVVAGDALTDLTSRNGGKIALSKIDQQGELVWKQIFDVKAHAMYDLYLQSDGSYIIAGTLFRTRQSDIFMIKATDPEMSASHSNAITPDSLETVEILETLTAHTGRITQVLFSPDGEYLASAGLDRKIRVWDVHTWQEIYTFDIRKVDLNSIAFSPDSRLLASALAIWDMNTGQVLYEINPSLWEPGHVAFSPDGSLLAVASFEPSIKLWDVASGQEVRDLEMPDVLGFFSVAFSQDGKQLAAGTPQHGMVTLWDVESGKISGTLELGNESDVHDIEFSPDGGLLVGGGTGYYVGVWEVANGELVDQLPLNNGIYGLTFSPDGKILALASCNRMAQLWEVETGRALRSLRHADELMSVAFSPDGSLLATGGYDNKVVIWGIP